MGNTTNKTHTGYKGVLVELEDELGHGRRVFGIWCCNSRNVEFRRRCAAMIVPTWPSRGLCACCCGLYVVKGSYIHESNAMIFEHTCLGVLIGLLALLVYAEPSRARVPARSVLSQYFYPLLPTRSGVFQIYHCGIHLCFCYWLKRFERSTHFLQSWRTN